MATQNISLSAQIALVVDVNLSEFRHHQASPSGEILKPIARHPEGTVLGARRKTPRVYRNFVLDHRQA